MTVSKKIMRNKVAGIALAATAALGTGAAYTQTAVAQPQDSPEQPERAERFEERLDELVQDGIISAERAQEIRDRMADRAEHREQKRMAREEQAQAIADTLGITVDDLMAARQAGTSLAELAAAAGVDVQTIIDQLVAAASEHVNQALADGDIDEAQATERIESLTDRITARVGGEAPAGVRHHRGPGRGHHFTPGDFAERFAERFDGQLPDGFGPGDFAERFAERFDGQLPDGFGPGDFAERFAERFDGQLPDGFGPGDFAERFAERFDGQLPDGFGPGDFAERFGRRGHFGPDADD